MHVRTDGDLRARNRCFVAIRISINRRGEKFGLVAGFAAARIAVRGGSGCGDARRLCRLDGHTRVGSVEQPEKQTLDFGVLVCISRVKLVYLRKQLAPLFRVSFEDRRRFFSKTIDHLAKGTKNAIELLQNFGCVFWSFDRERIVLDPVNVRLQRRSIRQYGCMLSHELQKGRREYGRPFGLGGRGEFSQIVHTLRKLLYKARIRTLRVSVVQNLPESGKARFPLVGSRPSLDDVGIDDSLKTLTDSGVLGGNLRQLVVREPANLQNRPDHIRETIIVVMRGHGVNQFPGRSFRGYPLTKRLLM